MSKTKSRFVCSECGAVSPQWLGKCPECSNFGTMVEEFIEEKSNSPVSNSISREKPLSVSDIKKETFTRKSTGIKELDNVLGGGLVPYSIILVGGDPGIGKSTIMTQVSSYLAKTEKVLYVSAEESLSQVKLRCERLKINEPNLMVLNENRLENIEIEAENYNTIIIDSIQAIYLSELQSSSGSVSQVKECASRLMRLAKSKHKTIFIIGHVTKEGYIAGPKVLEHIMDTVLYFEGEPQDNTKILRSVKNRFGSAQEVGLFEMAEDGIKEIKDYNGIFMSESRGTESGSIITPSLTGNRCMPVEIQSLVTKTVFGMPRRMPVGIDYNRLVLILAVLERKTFIPFYSQDVYVNAMGGIKLNEPSNDLAIALSLASANKNIIIDKKLAAFGEIGLTGEIRSVSDSEKRVKSLIKLGFNKIVLPKSNYNNCKKFEGDVELIPVAYLSQAIKLTLKEEKEKEKS